MQAVAVFRDGSVRTVEKPRPDPAPGEALVRTLRVGVDGTDRRIAAGELGEFPDGEDHLVLGHEAVGVVEDPNGTALSAGDVVVPTVRRPPADGTNEYFERGEPDYAPPGEFVERGIFGAHGVMAEYFTDAEEYLVPVPDALAEYGFLVEPASVAEKALEAAFASRSAFEWRRESALVLGTGSLGLTALARLAFGDEFDRTYCLGRRDRSDPAVEFVERVGATYVDSREVPLPDVPDAHEPVDLVYESTGHVPHAVETVEALAPNGVGALQGVPGSDAFEIDGGRLHEDLVLGNRALVGNVNSRPEHFAAAAEAFQSYPEWTFEALVSGTYRPSEASDALADDGPKAVVSFE
ncbi:glucose 1-dehydrogenase [Halostella sp. JP-L12]|uniref:glucose 1-dehydrogenase n=1 Tax=Halostella TaxID=1843185 RepID=UPI000EF7CBC4|nr:MULTISPECIES: glucose 1-dehydrogenase [Halostella]NHN47864.1 glucose 1-dehydrogenase [Halostella sp. JP-L12]